MTQSKILCNDSPRIWLIFALDKIGDFFVEASQNFPSIPRHWQLPSAEVNYEDCMMVDLSCVNIVCFFTGLFFSSSVSFHLVQQLSKAFFARPLQLKLPHKNRLEGKVKQSLLKDIQQHK
jgi:hypothetical protein